MTTGNNPILSATGDDTNIGIDITTKGTGLIKFNDLAYYPEASITSSSNAVAWDSSINQTQNILQQKTQLSLHQVIQQQGAVYKFKYSIWWNSHYRFQYSI
jgi:hypothetical protein